MQRLNWTTLALIGGLVLLLLVVAYFATRGDAGQDKLTGNVLSERSERGQATAPERTCASHTVYDLIKKELFRRAAQMRGSDQAAFDQISGAAVVRMEYPVLKSDNAADTGAVACSGSLSIDLPPGVETVGGRRTLTSYVDYTVQPAADGSGLVVLLSNADAMITALATLSRASQTAPSATSSVEQNGVASQPQAPADIPPALPRGVTPTPEPAPPPSAARPSFSCADARTVGEKAVCSDRGLAALDRSMAAEYGRAAGVATPEQRDLLRETAHRFYAYRDRCPDRQCIAAAYAGRIREIRDIVEGRWQPPR